jgi:hypothetical protein
MTTTIQPPPHPKWEAFKSSFKQSNYVTDFWNWFMTLMSKAAEMVLFGTVLYSGYQLLPGVPHVPPTIDAAVFVIQQGALDIGGMGLLKLAKRAGLPKDSFPVRLGVALVVLMILNVALASVKHTLPMIPDGVFVGIETLLLVARAVVAVLFGHAIHALREEYSESTITVKEASELQQRLDVYNEQLQLVQAEMQQHKLEVQGSVSTLVQSMVQAQTHPIMTELQTVQAEMDRTVQSQFKEVYALVHSLTLHSPEQAQKHDAASEQESGQAMRGSKRQANPSIALVHSVTDEQRNARDSEPLEQRIKQYILAQRRQGSEPSLAEIMDRCACSKGSAIRYRRELNESNVTGERRVIGQ